MKSKMIIRILVGFFFLIGSYQLSAQEFLQFKLLDSETNFPIIGASFSYGDEIGISNDEGIVEILVKDNTKLVLSHLSYGNWEIFYEELLAIQKQKVYYKHSEAVDLYPVTVFDVRSKRLPNERIHLDYQDKMAHDGAHILMRNPALSMIRKGGNYGFDPVFRGFKYDQLNIVLNGAQSTLAACPNRMDPPTSQMAPNMMDRIEVLKGPHALRYGTGIGGTINFIPARLQFTPSRDLYGRFSSGFESNGSLFRGETQLGMSNKAYDVSIFSSWSQGNDYLSGNGSVMQADFVRGSFGSNIGLKLSKNDQLKLSTFFNLAKDADFPALPMDLRKDHTWMLNAHHNRQFNGTKLQNWNTSVFASLVDHKMDNILKALEPRMLNAETNAKTSNFGLRSETKWKSGFATLFAGLDLRQEAAEGIRKREFLLGPNTGKTVFDNAWQDGFINKGAIFSEYHLNLNKYLIILSGRIELNQARINEASDPFLAVNEKISSDQINPGISLGLTRILDNKLKLSLWLARVQRSASLTERFINYFPVGIDPYEMLGNPGLIPEVNNQADFNMKWESKKISISADLFVSYLNDYISSVIDPDLNPRIPRSPGVRRYINIDNAFKTGFEFEWNQHLGQAIQHQLSLAYTYAQDLERAEPLPEIAPFELVYTVKGEFLKSRLFPEISLRYVAEQNRISQEFGETKTPDFSLVDLKVAYQLNTTIRLSTGVMNLLNVNYYEHLNRSVRTTGNPIFAQGRNFIATCNINF